MDQPRERRVALGGPSGRDARVWEKGDGDPLYYLAGIGGLPRWTEALELLSTRRRVIAPSLPGFPGAQGHDVLDDHLDWITATLDLLHAAGFQEGADLVGVSAGGALAAEVAALVGPRVRRLVLGAPFGIYDEAEPSNDAWCQKMGEAPQWLCHDPERWNAQVSAADGISPVDSVEWSIEQARANEAAARLLWPLGDTRIVKRLHRITCPTLLVWGAEDRILPASYAKRFADGISGQTEIASIPDAGHLVDLDAPREFAERVMAFLE